MKKIIIIMIAFSISLWLVACSDEETDTNKNDQSQSLEEDNNQTDTELENDSDEDSNNSSSGKFEVKSEDQLDLGLGDTGTFDTTLGTYDVTLVSAKLEEEINGEKSELDGFIILDFLVKNTSSETQNVEDIIYSLEVTHNLEGSGFPDGAEFFDGFEKLSGPLEPNEEMEGKFITFVYESEEYYFRKDPGNIAAGSSNQVIWTIKADEAR